MANLRDLKVVTKSAKVKFPGIEGFEVEVAAISRELARKLNSESEVTKLDPKQRVPVKEIDTETFIDKFAKAAIKGWTGLKYKHLPELMLVDLNGVEDQEEEVEYSHENAVELLKESQAFDTWLNDIVFSLQTFRN